MNNRPPVLLSVGARCRGVSVQDSSVRYVSFLLRARAVNSWCHPCLKKPVHCRSYFYFLVQTLIGSPTGSNKVAQNYYSRNISCLMGKVHRKPSKPWLQTHVIESHILNGVSWIGSRACNWRGSGGTNRRCSPATGLPGICCLPRRRQRERTCPRSDRQRSFPLGLLLAEDLVESFMLEPRAPKWGFCKWFCSSGTREIPTARGHGFCFVARLKLWNKDPLFPLGWRVVLDLMLCAPV